MERVSYYLSGWRWPLIAIGVSLAMLAAAHGFERFAYLAPCPLCLRQREIYWALIAMALVGLALWKWRPAGRFLGGLNVLIGLVFVTGAGIALYHMGVEYEWWAPPAGCATPTPDEGAAVAREVDLLGELDERIATAACTDVPWSMLGISMAGWNMIVSAGLALVSFNAARLTFGRDRSFITR